MSIEATARVLHHSAAKGSDKVVLLGIAWHDGAGGSWPSVTALAKYASIGERGARKCLDRLEAMGEIVRIDRPGRSNEYRITIACPPGCDGSNSHRIEGETPVPQDSPVHTDSPVPQDTPPLSARTGDPCPTGHPTPVRTDSRTVNEPSVEPSEEPSLFRADAIDPEPDRFEEFWIVFDRKVEKKKARDQWHAALKKPGVTASLIIEAAKQYIEWQCSEGKHPKFTVHPHRWLRDERWGDERAARKQSKAPEQKSNLTNWFEAIQSLNAPTTPSLGQTPPAALSGPTTPGDPQC